jgi:ATP-dependent helicase/nuclease subunit A
MQVSDQQSKEKLTPTQRRALQRNLNLAVTAGAGTGKTRVLVERYLDLLLSKEADIREILAITFTNKAAAEMMNRVAGRLDEMLNQKTTLSRRQELLNLRDRLSSAYISTIHAFCLRILREYPVEAGLDPDFSQLNEMQNELLIEQTISTELDKISTAEQQWLDLFRLFGPRQVQELLRSGLQHRFEMQPLVQKYLNSSLEILYQELSTLFLDRVIVVFRDYPFEEVQALSTTILRQISGTKQEHEQARKVRGLIERFSGLRNRADLDYWIILFELARTCTTGQATAYKVLTPLGGDKAWKNGSADHLKQLSVLLVPLARWLKETSLTPPGLIDRRVLEQLQKLYQLYTQVEKSYTVRKKEQSWVDFEDMLIRVRELLSNNTDLRNRIAAQFKFVLVDEFQDTNLLQWEIIAQLGEMQQNKFFIVGDPKQSIYGFRNADVRVFNRVRHEFAGTVGAERYPGNVVFDESFRFKENLASFINACFSRIMQQPAINQWEVEYSRLSNQRGDATGGLVEFALLEAADTDSDLQAEFIAASIKQILNDSGIQPGQIAVLLRTRNHLSAVEEQLRRHDIPFKTIGGIGFYQRQEIYDVYHLLRFLLNPHDDPALIGLLRSPFAGISDETLLFIALAKKAGSYWDKLEQLQTIAYLDAAGQDKLVYFRQQAERWLKRRERIYFSELLREIFQQSGYRAVMCAQLQGEQLAANLDKILLLAAEFEQTGFTTISEFTGYLHNLINTQVKEGEAPLALADRFTVKIMTIHQAKGLEFPVVFLPYLEQKIRIPRADETYFDEKLGLVSHIRKRGLPPDCAESDSYCLLSLVRQELRQKELAELKRLFYVGCTRAQNQLVLSACCDEQKVPVQTPLHWLLQAWRRQPQDLKEGEQLNWENSTILVRRKALTSAVSEDSTFSRVFDSLQQLKEIMKQKHSSRELPLFLKSIPGRPRGEIFSATQLMAFRHDKEEYYRRYHLGYFEGDYKSFRLAAAPEEKALLKGKLLHRYLQFYPQQDIERWLFEFDISDHNLIQELRQDVQVLTEKIRKAPFIQRVLTARAAHNEVAVLMQLEDDFITGTLDKIYQNEAEQWEVLDYKTNRIDRTQVQEVLDRYRIQIRTYALLLAHLYPQQQEYRVNFYFTHLDQHCPITFTREDLPQIEQDFIQIIREIKEHFEPYQSS